MLQDRFAEALAKNRVIADKRTGKIEVVLKMSLSDFELFAIKLASAGGR